MNAPRKKLTYANVMATIAVFVALGGGAYAASQLQKNSVGTKQLKNKSVTTAKIRNGAVTGAKVQVSSLGEVPSAAQADSASHAADADSLGGKPASAYAGAYVVRSATVNGFGNLVPSLTSGIPENQFVHEGSGYYCFGGISPAPTAAVASISAEVQGAAQGATAATSVDPSNAKCEVQVDTYDHEDNDANEPFSVIIH